MGYTLVCNYIKVAASSIVSINVPTKYERRTHKGFKTGCFLSEDLWLDAEPWPPITRLHDHTHSTHHTR